MTGSTEHDGWSDADEHVDLLADRTTSRDRAADPRALGSPLRAVAAGCAATIAFGLALLVEDRYAEAPAAGGLTAAAALALAVVAWRLLSHDTRATWWAALGLGGGVVVAQSAAAAAGYSAVSDDLGRLGVPVGVLGLLAALVLAGCAGLALHDARQRTAQRLSPQQRWAGIAVAVVGVSTLGMAHAAAVSPITAEESALLADAAHAGHATAVASASTDAYWAAVQGAPYHPTGVVRTYYVEADEVVWNYAPSGRNQITGEPFDETADVFVKRGPGRIGSSYLKCLYRGYTDSSFSTRKQVPASESYLGFMGPVIRGEVGDTIKVVFRNTCRIPASVHPHGVFYQKASEGAPYADNTSGMDKKDDAVPRYATHTYTWLVPDRAGPGPHDGSSVMWMYHSHTDEVGDTYAGLQGFMVVTAKGMARADGSPKDVDREIFELFSVMNENNSPYLDTNVHRYAGKPYAAPDDEGFGESNLMHSINGYVYGNQPVVSIKRGQPVRWYLMSMGTEVDLHTPHWHGNTVLSMGMRMDVVNLLPATMVTADMVPDDPGTWLFHCHVNDHLTAGMITRYKVT